MVSLSLPKSPALHAVVGLTKTAALEYAKAGIRVNAVCPGAIDTPMIARSAQAIPGFDELAVAMEPVGRFGQSSEIGEAVAWLCSDAALPTQELFFPQLLASPDVIALVAEEGETPRGRAGSRRGLRCVKDRTC